MAPDPRAQAIIESLLQGVLRKRSIALQEDTPLVSSGLLDSFALVEVLHEVEKVTGRRIPAGRVGPGDFETVARMLAMAERVGKPR